MTYNTLLVDDESLALARLTRLLHHHTDQIRVTGSACTGPEAVRLIGETDPDLVFLDIHLGSMNGFEVLNQIDTSPLIIFTTAYDHYALRAFETNSVDYLLKPIDPERLAKALTKLATLERAAQPTVPTLRRVLSELQTPKRIQVSLGTRIKLLDPAEILYFQAGDKYVEVFTEDGSYLINQSLTQLEEEMRDQSFIRTHRSVLVNAIYIDEIGKSQRHGLYVLLKDTARTRLPLSRQAKTRLGL